MKNPYKVGDEIFVPHKIYKVIYIVKTIFVNKDNEYISMEISIKNSSKTFLTNSTSYVKNTRLNRVLYT